MPGADAIHFRFPLTRRRVLAIALVAMPALAGATYALIPRNARPAAVAATPSANPQQDNVDWASPLSVAVASFHYSMRPDPQKFRQTLWGANAEEQRLADAIVEVYSQAQYLNDLAKARFGLDASVGIVPSRDDLPEVDTSLWKVQVNGDTAVVTRQRGMNPREQHLRKVAGRWQVDIYPTMAPATAANRSAQDIANRMFSTARAMRQTADELLAGRFDTAEQARDFLRRSTYITTMRQRNEASGQ